MSLLWLCTRSGIGFGGDSYYYVNGAQNLLAGHGYSRFAGGDKLDPITHFPPFFSLALAVLYSAGLGMTQAPLVLNLFLFGLSAVLIGLTLIQNTTSGVFPLLGATLFVASAGMLKVYSWAMSEPLYLVLSIGGVLLLVTYFERARWGWMVASAAALGLAYLTRYVGLSLIITGFLIILVRYKVPLVQRLKEISLFGVVSLLPVLAFMARNYALTGYTTNRQVIWHPLEFERFRKGLGLIMGWFLPTQWLTRFGIKLSIAGLLLVLVAIIWLDRQRIRQALVRLGTCPSLGALMLVYLVTYLSQVVLSISLFDYSTPLDDRILSPVFVCILVLVVILLSRLWSLPSRPMRWVGVGLSLVMLAYSTVGAISQVQKLQADGQGFTRTKWQDSSLMESIRDLPPEIQVYTNEYSLVWFWTGRAAYAIPSYYDPVTNQSRPTYPDDLAKMKEKIQHGAAVLALFNPEMLDPQYYSLKNLTQNLLLSQNLQDGAIYK